MKHLNTCKNPSLLPIPVAVNRVVPIGFNVQKLSTTNIYRKRWKMWPPIEHNYNLRNKITYIKLDPQWELALWCGVVSLIWRLIRELWVFEKVNAHWSTRQAKNSSTLEETIRKVWRKYFIDGTNSSEIVLVTANSAETVLEGEYQQEYKDIRELQN